MLEERQIKVLELKTFGQKLRICMCDSKCGKSE